MKTVGVFEAKTHFSALIEQAREGQTFTITRNGEPVAQIVPVPGRDDQAREAMERILSTRAKLKGPTIRELIDEGRRY